MAEFTRAFIALPLSESIAEQLRKIQRTLDRKCPMGSVRWVPPENIHLTLFFMGDTLPERLEATRSALAVVARQIGPFSFTVQHGGAFPNVHRPRVVWVGIEEPTGKLSLLHDVVNEAMERIGFVPEERTFSPHLTLGRVGRNAGPEDTRAIGRAVAEMDVGILGVVQARELILFRSVLKSTGAEYSPIATYPFGLAER